MPKIKIYGHISFNEEVGFTKKQTEIHCKHLKQLIEIVLERDLEIKEPNVVLKTMVIKEEECP